MPISFWVSILTDDSEEIKKVEMLGETYKFIRTENGLEMIDWKSKIVTVHKKKYREYYTEPLVTPPHRICIPNDVYNEIENKNVNLFYHHGYACTEMTRKSIEPLANLSDKFIGVDIKDMTRLRCVWKDLDGVAKIGLNRYVTKLDCVRTLTRKLRDYCNTKRNIRKDQTKFLC